MTPFALRVSDHAYWRAAERFPGFRTETIEDEVASALVEGRISAKPIPGIRWTDAAEDGLYAWTPDGRRVYGLRVHKDDERSFVITTVMRAER